MNTDWLIYAGIGVFVIGIAVQSLRRRDRAAQLVRDLESYAEVRGFRVDQPGSQRRNTTQINMTDPMTGLALSIRMEGPGAETGPGLKRGFTALLLPEVRLDGGLAVYLLPLLPSSAGVVSSFSGALDNPVARRVLGKLVGPDIGDTIGRLREFPAPDGVDLSILADVDPSQRFDAAAIARALDGMPKDRKTTNPRSFITISGRGLELRTSYALASMAQIEAFLETGETLQAALQSG